MKTINNIPSIKQEINRIFGVLSIHVPKDMAVTQEPPRKGSSSGGIISILSREDKDRMDADRNYRAIPITRYVFYPSVYFPSRLGSVAIYGDEATALCGQLKSQRTFFGIEIIDATVEYGRRPFVDVRLRY